MATSVYSASSDRDFAKGDLVVRSIEDFVLLLTAASGSGDPPETTLSGVVVYIPGGYGGAEVIGDYITGIETKANYLKVAENSTVTLTQI